MNLHYQYYWFKEVIPHDMCDKIIQMGNKKIEQMIPKTIEKHVIKPSENPPNIVIEEYDDDVDIAINELLT